jgi:hypothetical protein
VSCRVTRRGTRGGVCCCPRARCRRMTKRRPAPDRRAERRRPGDKRGGRRADRGRTRRRVTGRTGRRCRRRLAGATTGGRTRRGGCPRRGGGHAADDTRGEVGCVRGLPAGGGRDVRRPRSGLSGTIPRRRRRTRNGGGDPFALDEHRPDRRHLRRAPDPYDVAAEPAHHVAGPRTVGRTGPDEPGQAARRHRCRQRSRCRRGGTGVLTVTRPPVLPPARRLHALRDRPRSHRFRSAQRSAYVGRVRGGRGEPRRRHRDTADRRRPRARQWWSGPAEPARDRLAEAHAAATTTVALAVITHLLTNP